MEKEDKSCPFHPGIENSLHNIEKQLGVKEVEDKQRNGAIQSAEEESKTLYSMIRSIDEKISDKPDREEVDKKIDSVKSDFKWWFGFLITMYLGLIGIIFAHISGKL